MAKTETTVKGYVYTVTSPNGGTVTDAEGKLNKPVAAGDQITVQAPSDSLSCDDDDAVIYKTNFKSPLLALRLLGQGENALPAGYTRLEFLQGAGRQYIDAQTPADSSSEVLCVFERLNATSKAVYSTSTNQSTAMLNCFVWGGNLNDIRFDWGSKNYAVKGKYNGGWVTSVQSPNGVYLNGEQVITHAQQEPFSVPGMVLFTFSAAANEWTANNVRISRWALKNDGKHVRDMVAVLDQTGTPCMYDRVSKQPFKNRGTGQFIAGVGNVAQLTNLLRNLPATGGTLTLSLPAEANTPEVADMLQACHDTKGWTLTVHEYRPAEASTYSLRRVLDVVWCRRELSDLGSYVDADGFRWQLDRCAAIFGALGQDPSAYGYTPFDSLEQATEFWGLVPYVDPNAEELTTEFEK